MGLCRGFFAKRGISRGRGLERVDDPLLKQLLVSEVYGRQLAVLDVPGHLGFAALKDDGRLADRVVTWNCA